MPHLRQAAPGPQPHGTARPGTRKAAPGSPARLFAILAAAGPGSPGTGRTPQTSTMSFGSMLETFCSTITSLPMVMMRSLPEVEMIGSGPPS